MSPIELDVVGITHNMDDPVIATYEFNRKAVDTVSIIDTIIARLQRAENRSLVQAINNSIQNNIINLPVTEIDWESPGQIGNTTPNTGKFTTLESTGVLTTAASASGAGLRIPHGTAPSSPVDGAVWTTTSGMYVRINGTTIGPLIDAKGIPWAVPGQIGNTTPNTGKFTTLESTGVLKTAASASGAAGLLVPHGTAPSSPVDGAVWTTTSGMYVRINGKTIGPLGSAKWKRYGGA